MNLTNPAPTPNLNPRPTPTYWNGQPALAMQVNVILKHINDLDPEASEKFKHTYWYAPIMHNDNPVKRHVNAVEIYYNNELTYISDNHPGRPNGYNDDAPVATGWFKVTDDLGAPNIAHMNIIPDHIASIHRPYHDNNAHHAVMRDFFRSVDLGTKQGFTAAIEMHVLRKWINELLINNQEYHEILDIQGRFDYDDLMIDSIETLDEINESKIKPVRAAHQPNQPNPGNSI